MHDTVLIAHLIGLMMGAGGGFGATIAARTGAKLPPEQAGPLRALGPKLARLSSTGLALMWATGLTLAATQGGFAGMPALFWVKIAFVLTLTLAAIATEVTYCEIKSGKVEAAARLAILGPIAGASSMLAVVFAILTFH